jgi:HlyD family secretion protein
MVPPSPQLDDLRIKRSAAPAATGRSGLIAGAVVALVLVASLAWWLRQPQPVSLRTAVAREVSGTGAERTVLNASGYVTARREATVSSKVTGKVTEVLIEEGVKVEAGQMLARLDDTNVQASLQLARAQLEATRTSRGNADPPEGGRVGLAAPGQFDQGAGRHPGRL